MLRKLFPASAVIECEMDVFCSVIDMGTVLRDIVIGVIVACLAFLFVLTILGKVSSRLTVVRFFAVE